jgi:hypothetical protein
MTGAVGHSRSSSELGGGLAYAIGLTVAGKPRWGIELGRFHLGSIHQELRRDGIFPGEPPGIHISDRSQYGWRLVGLLDLVRVGRFTWTASLGYYRFTGAYSSQTVDTTRQVVLRPRLDYGGASHGAGVSTGVRADLLRLSQDLSISLEAAVHGIGLRTTGDDPGYSGFYYFGIGGRIHLRL